MSTTDKKELLECPDCGLQTRWEGWKKCIDCTPCPFGGCDGSCTICNAKLRFGESLLLGDESEDLGE